MGKIERGIFPYASDPSVDEGDHHVQEAFIGCSLAIFFVLIFRCREKCAWRKLLIVSSDNYMLATQNRWNRVFRENLRRLTDRASELLSARLKSATSIVVFVNREGKPYLGTSINHLHRDVCAPKVDGERCPIFPADFVLHSLRHTMLSRLGESGVDAFTIMRIAGHSSIVVSQRYIHPTPEAVERAFERLQLSGNVKVIRPKRQLPATVSATVAHPVAVSH
jgi:hypothetical protein